VLLAPRPQFVSLNDSGGFRYARLNQGAGAVTQFWLSLSSAAMTTGGLGEESASTTTSSEVEPGGKLLSCFHGFSSFLSLHRNPRRARLWAVGVQPLWAVRSSQRGITASSCRDLLLCPDGALQRCSQPGSATWRSSPSLWRPQPRQYQQQPAAAYPPPPRTPRSEPCFFWLRGECRKGPSCPFRHYDVSQMSQLASGYLAPPAGSWEGPS